MRQEICFDEHILPRERALLLKALSHYKLRLLNIYRKRSAYKIIAEEGIFCLKRMKSGEDKIKRGYIVSEELRNSDFPYLAKYLTTRDKKIYVKEMGYLFYLTTWIDGREANLKDINEAIMAVRLLARFHIETNKTKLNRLGLQNNAFNWRDEWLEKLNELRRYSDIIDRKVITTEFDRLYNSETINQINYGLKALELISKYTYYKIDSIVVGICHDSYYYQNLIMMQDNLYIIDLDSLVLNIQIIDLAKLIRRLMYKDEYSWSFSKIKRLIEEYGYIKPLSKDELYLILAVAIFPHRFWKLGRKRYYKGTSWTEERYLKKLKKVLDNKSLYENFYRDFINYIEIQ